MSFRHPLQNDFPSNRFDWLDRPEWASVDEWEQLIDFFNILDEGPVGGGTQGPQGPQGIQGPVGPQGVQGAMGTSFVWRGTWSGATAYVTNDAVERSGETYISIQNGTNQDPAVGQPDNAFWDVLAVAGVQGPTGADGAQGVAGATGATGAAGPPFDFEQTTDPGAVGAGKWWADTTPGGERVGRRNQANTDWVFFSVSGGGGAGSGYGVGGFGDVSWDTTVTGSTAWTLTTILDLYKNLYATVGWGLKYNDNMDLLDAAFTDVEARLAALEA